MGSLPAEYAGTSNEVFVAPIAIVPGATLACEVS